MESRLFLNHDKVPSTTPRNYYTRAFLFQVIILFPLIVIKSILVIFFILSAWINCFIYNHLFSRNQWIYNVYFYPMYQILKRITLFCSGILYINVRDDRKDKNKPRIYVTNHLGIMDFVIFFTQIRGRPMAKKELFTSSFFYTFAVFCKYIPVDRSNKENRKDSFNKLEEVVNDLDKGDGFSIFLCPEMCVTSGESLIHFASGAFRLKKPVTPLVVKFSGIYKSTALRADDDYFLSIIDLLSCWKIDCEVHFMEEYEPSLEECDDVKLFANNVRNKMAENLEVKTTEYMYADVLIYNASYVFVKETNKYESLFYDGYIDSKRLDEVFKFGDYKKVVRLVREFKKKLQKNNNTFLLSSSDHGLRKKSSIKGSEKGIKLTDYIINKFGR